MSVSLVLLKCRKCGSDLSSEKEGAFFYCASCGTGFVLDQKSEFLEVPVYFALYNTKKSNVFLPFWVFDARMKMCYINSSASTKTPGLSKLFGERGTIRFYVGAFLEDLKTKMSYGLAITSDQPELKYIDRQESVKNVVFSIDDAREIAHYIFLTSEIITPDKVKSAEYELVLENPMLIVIGV